MISMKRWHYCSLAVVGMLTAYTALGDNLSYIDARGVTEDGGTGAEHMLVRTNSDGKINDTLLPASAGGAVSPISGMYYVTSSSGSGGTGSIQSPYHNIASAYATRGTGSAFICAPGTHTAGSITLTAGSNLTIVGLGPSTVISGLSVTGSGNSTATEVRFINVDVTSLTVSGTLRVKLGGTKVQYITGSGSIVVERTDMGSRIESSALSSYTDIYSGYSTAPKAQTLDNGTTTVRMTADRAKMRLANGTEKDIAFIDDITGTSSSISNLVETLRAADTELGNRITAEVEARTTADNNLSQRIDELSAQIGTGSGGSSADVAALEDRVDAVEDTVAALNTSLNTTNNRVSELSGTVSSITAGYTAGDTAVRAEYQAADLRLEQDMTDQLDAAVAALREEIASAGGGTGSADMTGYVQYVNRDEDLGAVTLGQRTSGAVGQSSFVHGDMSAASGTGSHVIGRNASDLGRDYTFVWNPDDLLYRAQGTGSTFNINPDGGIDGVFIGTESLGSLLDAKVNVDDFNVATNEIYAAIAAVAENAGSGGSLNGQAFQLNSVEQLATALEVVILTLGGNTNEPATQAAAQSGFGSGTLEGESLPLRTMGQLVHAMTRVIYVLGGTVTQ